MTFFRRSILALLLICLGCSAQSVNPDTSQRIERQVRAYYSVPASVKISIGALKPSEFPNYDALTISMQGEDKKRDYDFLLSRDGKTLIRMTKLDLSKDPYAAVMAKIDVNGRPTRGNKNAKVVVVDYDDFQCPFCSRMHQTLFPTLLQEYGDRVLFIYKDFPLAEIHPWAVHAAVNANCLSALSNDAYWDFADYIHANPSEVNAEKGTGAQFSALDHIAHLQGQKHSVDAAKLQSCIAAQNQDAVKASVHEGENLGVSATPTMFVNGQQIDGAVPIAELRAIFDRALQQAGEKPPAHPASETGTSSSPSK